MSHLSPAELVDAADGTLAPGRAAHLQRCPSCAARVADVHAVSETLLAADVPDPSPLYWQHLSAHLRARVEHEVIVPAWRATDWREYVRVRALVPIASAVAVVAVVVASGVFPRHHQTALIGTVLVGTPAADVSMEPEDSEVWQVLTSAAAEVPIEDAHAAGMSVGTGAVDRAVQRMTPDELTELSRLLQSELGRSGD